MSRWRSSQTFEGRRCAEVCSAGMNDASRASNDLQISRSVRKNPHPDKTISSLRFICKDPNSPPACFCVAITGELSAAAPRPAEQPPVAAQVLWRMCDRPDRVRGAGSIVGKQVFIREQHHVPVC